MGIIVSRQRLFVSLRRFAYATAICLGAAWLWAAVLRPLPPSTGFAPVSLGDGWAIAAPAAVGVDEAALHRHMRALLDAPLEVHALLVERHGQLIAETYQSGLDRSVYAPFATRHEFGPEQQHDVRSVGKSVTSLLYGIALQEGRVPDPATPMAVVYPRLAGASDSALGKIRVQHLLDMSSGLQWQEGGRGINDELRLFWKSDIPAYVLSHPVQSVPGTVFNYDGGHTAVLADLIARGAGMPMDEYARRRLFEPLGIRDWEWIRDLHGRPMAFNGLRMRPRDLLKIGRLVLNGGRWHGREVVPAAWITHTLSPHLATGVRDYRYGGQWWSGEVQWQGRRVNWHAGFGNGGQRVFVVPALDLVIVTTAGAYENMTTAAAVNDFVQKVVDCVIVQN